MGSQTSELIEIGTSGEIQIWRRTDQKIAQFYCRVWLPPEARENRRNPYKRKALGCDDLEEAKGKALEFAAEVRAKVRTRESIFTVPFRKAARAYVADLEARVRSGEITRNKLNRARTSVERYLIPFFQDRSLDNLDEAALEQFLRWRRDYYTTGPGKNQTHVEFVRNGKTLQRPLTGSRIPGGSTLAKDMVTMSLILDFARHKRWISRKPDFPKLKTDGNRRPDFLPEDQQRILRYFNATDPRHGITIKDREQASPQTRRAWALLEYFVRFMLATGVRVQEAHGLCWRHIELKDPQPKQITWYHYHPVLTIEAEPLEDEPVILSGDTKVRIRIPRNLPGLKSPNHARVVIPTADCFGVIGALRSIYKVFDDRDPEPDDPLFMHPNQEPLGSFRNAFGTLLEKLKLQKQDRVQRSLTSLRHTYACNRLRRGTSVYVLCKNMGTSEAMIRRHYDHLIAEEFAGELED